MCSDLDIGWLAGVFDGEGCVFVQRSRRRGKAGVRVVHSVVLKIANSSSILIERCKTLLGQLGVGFAIEFEPRFTKRPMFYVKVNKKHDALVLALALLPHLTAKRDEIQMAIWYLERSCKSRQHVATAQDVQVLDAITSVKHGVPIPDDVAQLVH